MDSPASKRSPRLLITATVLTLAALLPGACGPPGRARTVSAAGQLTPYGPEAAAIFNDTLAPAVFGASLDGSDAAGDPALTSRTEQAESILPVKVSTVTSESEGGSPTYTLILRPAGPPLTGKAWNQPINIEIGPDNPSFPFMRSADSTLVGKEFILFFRRYNERGQTTLHWRGEADTPALRAAVERARLVGGLGS